MRFFANYATTADGLRADGDADLDELQELEGEWLKDTDANQGWGAFWQGDWGAAEEFYRKSVDEVKRGQPWIWNGVYTGMLIDVLAHEGKRDEALALARQVQTDLPQPGKPAPLGAWGLAVVLIEAFAILGEKAQAHDLYPLVVEAMAHGALWVYGRSADMAAGVAAASGEDWDVAARHFEAALALLAAEPRLTEDIDTRRYYAIMLLERGGPGDAEHAARLLETAVPIRQGGRRAAGGGGPERAAGKGCRRLMGG